MLTFLPIEEIEAMEAWEGSQLNRAKEILAYELTTMVHGKEEADKAEASARALFSQGSAADMPTTDLGEADLTDGQIDILTLLVKAELVPTKSEARRNVQQGGVTVNDEKVTDLKKTFGREELAEGLVVRRGKKSFRKVCLK